MKYIQIACLVALLILVPACGSGGGSGGSTPDPGTGLGAAFQTDPSAPSPTPPETVTAGQSAASNNMVTIEVNVTDTDGIHGAAFDVMYDADHATYMDWSNGNLLEQGSTNVQYVVSEPTAGHLVVSANRQGTGPGADANGTRTVIELVFEVGSVGVSSLSFQANWLLDDQSLPQTMPGIAWFGGSLIGT